jgi:DNA processing protein
MVSTNTKAILLLTSPLIIGRARSPAEILTHGEYNKLARALIENNSEPGDLLGPGAVELIASLQNVVESNRLTSLLGRGFLLSQAIERWEARSIWVFSRADIEYPQRLKARLKDAAPALLFGCGDNSLLDRGGLAVVGSRNVNENLIKYTENVGRLAARAEIMVISGGAKGIDRAAMFGSLQAGGCAAGVVADSLERLALSADSREYIMENKLVLI